MTDAATGTTRADTFEDPLVIAGEKFHSRLIMGTGGAPSLHVLADALRASGTEMTTVAMRRVDPNAQGSVWDVLRETGVRPLPNTAGCFTAVDALRTARLGREALETNWVKLEVVADERTLLPDPVETLDAAERLVDEGFVVLAYTNDDPVLGLPAGAGGVCRGDAVRGADRFGDGHPQPAQHRTDRRRAGRPCDFDAGIGTASDAALPWNWAATRCCWQPRSLGPRIRC